jgi:hypothetical protein
MKCVTVGGLLIMATGLAVSVADVAPRTVVICAPGFPGDTESARTTMEAFARAASEAAEWPDGSLRAVYHPDEQGGLERLAGDDVVLAIVPLPLFLRSGERFDLRPVLQIENSSGPDEIWSLAARRGALPSPTVLDGWEITGSPGYAPAFVRGPILGEWGELPDGARITATSSVLGALRRAAAGEKVAVLLDTPQTASLSSLPFAQDLEVVARSGRLPGAVLCTVGDRLPAAEADAFLQGLLRLHRTPAGEEALAGMRLKRFRKLDEKGLEAARRSYLEAKGSAPDHTP